LHVGDVVFAKTLVTVFQEQKRWWRDYCIYLHIHFQVTTSAFDGSNPPNYVEELFDEGYVFRLNIVSYYKR